MTILCSLLGYYFTGDGARRDIDGHYHITGRVDDVINVKGVRLGTAEVEDIMVSIKQCLSKESTFASKSVNCGVFSTSLDLFNTQ